MEKYFTVNELSEKIKFSKQSLYNLIYKGTFVLGKHYLKPTPKKILFKWSEIQRWLGESLCADDNSPIDSAKGTLNLNVAAKDKSKSSINI
jgi:hypothetical protein